MKKMYPNEVYRIIEEYVRQDILYARQHIADIAEKTGWAEASIKLALDLELWLPTSEDLYALEEADASDFEVFATAGSPDSDMSEDIWDRAERVDTVETLNFHDDDEPRNNYQGGRALNNF